MASWPQLKYAPINGFETLEKEKVARNKLARWKQLKNVVTFYADLQNTILGIPNISIEEQIFRYTRGLKS